MKILLLGDFSSSMRFLKKGFEENGCQVDHYALQNGWRENPISNQLNSNRKSPILSRLETYKNCLNLRKLRGYEMVILNSFFPFPKLINKFIIEEISENCNQTILWLTGCDSKTNKVFEKIYPDLCKNCLEHDQKNHKCKTLKDQKKENEIKRFITKYVPSSIEYHNAYSKGNSLKDKLTSIVPLALDPNDPEILNNQKLDILETNGKLNLMHSISRKGMKGSIIFENGYRKFSNEIGIKNKLNFKKYNRLPFQEYLKKIQANEMNFDQLHNRSIGITSLLTMSLGRLLIAGDSSEFTNKLSYPNAPYWSIKDRTEEGIKESLLSLNSKSKKDIKMLALESQAYVHEFHSPKKVGHDFLREVLRN